MTKAYVQVEGTLLSYVREPTLGFRYREPRLLPGNRAHFGSCGPGGFRLGCAMWDVGTVGGEDTSRIRASVLNSGIRHRGLHSLIYQADPGYYLYIL